MTYKKMQKRFQSCFDQELTDDDIASKKGGIIGDENLELGTYVWSKDHSDNDHSYIEYYVHWLPHIRGDSHGIIYKDGTHEHLDTLPTMGDVSPEELSLRKELVDKGLIYCPIMSEEARDKKASFGCVKRFLLSITKIWNK